MLPLQSIEASPPSINADENGEPRHQKPKALPCKYCSKRFRSVTMGAAPSASSMSYIGLHYPLILGVWSMSRDMREPIPRKSPSPVAGLVAGRRLGDGERVLFCASFLCFVLPPHGSEPWSGLAQGSPTCTPPCCDLPSLRPQALPKLPLSLPPLHIWTAFPAINHRISSAQGQGGHPGSSISHTESP